MKTTKFFPYSGYYSAKYIHRIFTLLLFIISSSIILAHPFAGGSGTVEDPYLIETPEQLQNIDDNIYLSRHFKLIADIDLNEICTTVGWKPIGIYRDGFKGTLDGNALSATCLSVLQQARKLLRWEWVYLQA